MDNEKNKPNPAAAAEAAAPAVPPRWSADGRDLAFACVSLLCAGLLVCWGFWGGWNLGRTLAYFVWLLSATLYFGKHSVLRPYGVACGLLSLGLACVLPLTGNEAVRACAVALLFACAVVFSASLAGLRIPQGDFGLLRFGLRHSFGVLSAVPPAMQALFAGESMRKKRVVTVLISVTCALPVLAILVPLLASSDAAFEGLISRVVAVLGKRCAQAVCTVLVAPLLIAYLLRLRHKPEKDYAPEPDGKLEALPLTVFLTAISLVYLVYLLSQLAYFFSAFSGLLPAGYTHSYADYARRGFFELCAIAAINFVLLAAALLLFKKKTPTVALKLPMVFIGAVTLLLIATAISKMVLYIRAYGMTDLRVCTGAFMVFLAVVFLALLLRLFSARVRVLQTALIAASIVILALGLGDVDSVIARYNTQAYLSGKLQSVDCAYLLQQGAAGVPSLIRLTEDPKVGTYAAQKLADYVLWNYDGDYSRPERIVKDDNQIVDRSYYVPSEQPKTPFYAWNRPEVRAHRALDAYLEAHPDFLRTYATQESYFWTDDAPDDRAVEQATRQAVLGKWEPSLQNDLAALDDLFGGHTGGLRFGEDGTFDFGIGNQRGAGTFFVVDEMVNAQFIGEEDGTNHELLFFFDHDLLELDYEGRTILLERG